MKVTLDIWCSEEAMLKLDGEVRRRLLALGGGHVLIHYWYWDVYSSGWLSTVKNPAFQQWTAAICRSVPQLEQTMSPLVVKTTFLHRNVYLCAPEPYGPITCVFDRMWAALLFECELDLHTEVNIAFCMGLYTTHPLDAQLEIISSLERLKQGKIAQQLKSYILNRHKMADPIFRVPHFS